VTSGLQNLRQLIHENMLPALDRCSLILSRFAGIAKFRGSSETVGFSAQQISLLHDSVACLHLVGSKMLMQVIDELELFTAFSAWLRHEIDRLASEGSSTTEDDAAEKESALDHSKVLQYIQTALRASLLANYLGKDSDDGAQAENKGFEQGTPMFDTLSRQIKKMEQGQPYTKVLPKQAFLAQHLSTQAGEVFQQIADAEKRNVLFGDVHNIGAVRKNSPLHMKVDAVVRLYRH
jgi:anaphase-promoting complex subunit 4